ncbi:MAG: polyribonucleotide nucleotidyltransferase, partial [Parachlamydiales bacterium]
MTQQEQKIAVDLDGGKTLVFETGKIARQAHGSVLLHLGETTLLATACRSNKASEEIDFFPLRVDYQEKFSSVGRTLSGFIKREGRPTQKEILTSRFIDRSIRPLFPDGYFNEVQILSYVYSYDGLHIPDVLAICAASAALTLSDIPFLKPIGAVRIGLLDENFIINPNPEELKKSQLDLILSGTEDALLMIEGSCDFLTEEIILKAAEFGHAAIRKICQALSGWQAKIGKPKNLGSVSQISQEALEAVRKHSEKDLNEALRIKEKKLREEHFSKIKTSLFEELLAEEKEAGKFLKRDLEIAFKNLSSALMRKMILEENRRIDGRALDEIRPISIETSLFPRTHGNAVFTRGETQAIAVCTLGSTAMVERYEDLHGEGESRFYLQYFFPPFSVGEVGRSGPPGRREIGHGKLAEKALKAILPDMADFPYVIRMESNITESNGSSSMASV